MHNKCSVPEEIENGRSSEFQTQDPVLAHAKSVINARTRKTELVTSFESVLQSSDPYDNSDLEPVKKQQRSGAVWLGPLTLCTTDESNSGVHAV